MPIFTIELPDGRRMEAEAQDEASALSGAEQWYKQNVTKPTTINIEGRSVTVDPSFHKLSAEQQNETVDEIAGTLGLRKTDTSIVGALSQGASDVVGGVGKTIKEYIAPEAGKTVQDAGKTIANPKYKSATEQFSNPSDGADKHFMGRDWSALPRVLAEQAPGMATDILATLALKRLGPLAQVAGGVGSHMLRTTGDEAQRRATGRTSDANAETTTEDRAIGLGSSAAQAALNQLGIGKIVKPAKFGDVGISGVAKAAGNVAKAAATEGATEAAQEGISQTASTAGTNDGLRLDPGAMLDAGAFGAVGGGAFSAPKGAKDSIAAVRFRNVGGDLAPQSAAVANRIMGKVKDASELQSPSTAFKATSDTQADVLRELSLSASALRKRNALTTEADNAVSRASQGRDLNEADLEAIESTKGAEDLKALAKQAVVLNRLTRKGNYDTAGERFAGGVAERVRRLVRSNPLAAGATYAGGGALTHGSGVEDIAMAAATNALPAAGAYAGVKAAERAMGISSPARSFVEKFADLSVGVRPEAAQEPHGASSGSVPSVPYRAPARPWGEASPPLANDTNATIDDGIADIVQDLRIADLRKRAGALAKMQHDTTEPESDPDDWRSRVNADLAVKRTIDRQDQAERSARYAGLSDAEVRERAVQEAVEAGVIQDAPASRARYGQGVQRKRDLIRDAVHRAANSDGYTDRDVEAFQPFLRRLMVARTGQEATDIILDAAKALSFDGGHALMEKFGKDTIATIWRK